MRVRRSAAPYRRGLREEMFKAYGRECKCCGLNISEFLTLEHLAGDGAAHRREVGRNAQAQLVDLRRKGWPEGYTVLCFNCNIAKAACGGVCPHVRAGVTCAG